MVADEEARLGIKNRKVPRDLMFHFLYETQTMPGSARLDRTLREQTGSDIDEAMDDGLEEHLGECSRRAGLEAKEG